MNSKFSVALASLALTASMFAVGASAAHAEQFKRAPQQLVAKNSAITPLSMQYFCAKHKNECAGGGSSQVKMSTNLMTVLKQVNIQVNNAIKPARDRADVWELNPTSGDCEDYVLSKRSSLVRHGVSAGALRIAYTHTRSGAPHAVLVVRTDEGDYVLDNLNNAVKSLRATGYNIRSMSSPRPTQWVAG